MKLAPREVEKTELHSIGFIAQQRLAAGLRLVKYYLNRYIIQNTTYINASLEYTRSYSTIMLPDNVFCTQGIIFCCTTDGSWTIPAGNKSSYVRQVDFSISFAIA